jgi:hypothetical protein
VSASDDSGLIAEMERLGFVCAGVGKDGRLIYVPPGLEDAATEAMRSGADVPEVGRLIDDDEAGR